MKRKSLSKITGFTLYEMFIAMSRQSQQGAAGQYQPPPGNFAATFYAPSADFTMNGNPDIIAAFVCKSFYGNGNTSWHYDRALDNVGNAVDYRIVSYEEDIRQALHPVFPELNYRSCLGRADYRQAFEQIG